MSRLRHFPPAPVLLVLIGLILVPVTVYNNLWLLWVGSSNNFFEDAANNKKDSNKTEEEEKATATMMQRSLLVNLVAAEIEKKRSLIGDDGNSDKLLDIRREIAGQLVPPLRAENEKAVLGAGDEG